MSIVFDCGWEDGSDEKNTGGSSVFDSITDSANCLSFDTSSAMWNSNCLKYYGNAINTAYVRKNQMPHTCGVRLGFKLNIGTMSNGTYFYLFRIHDGGVNVLYFRIYKTGGLYYAQVLAHDTGNTGRQVGSSVQVSLDTKYQLLIKLSRNTAGGCSFKIFAEDGTTLIGDEQNLSSDYTTYKGSTIRTHLLGLPVSLGSAQTFYYDIYQVLNTYDYPDTVVAASGFDVSPTMFNVF